VSAETLFNEIKDRRPDLLEPLLAPIATDRRGEVPEGMLPYLLIPVFNWCNGRITPFYQRQYIESAQRFDDAPRLTDAWPEIENRRHLLRLWLSIPGDRELPEIFSTRYGSIEVGNRGGIVVPGTQFCIPWTREIIG